MALSAVGRSNASKAKTSHDNLVPFFLEQHVDANLTLQYAWHKDPEFWEYPIEP